MKKPPGFHPEAPLFPLPLDGGGKGEGDRGEGVSGSISIKDFSERGAGKV